MIFINEWLPNPIGNDAKGEFVELFNTSGARVRLDGWSLWTGGKSKKVSLGGFSIAPDGYLVLGKAQIKLSLKNTAGALWLYGPRGALIDHASFKGSAPEGKSFSRVDYGAGDIQHFAFVDPTPGAANKAINNEVATENYPMNVPLNPAQGAVQSLGLLLGAALSILAALTYIFYKNENLSHILFRRDAGAR